MRLLSYLLDILFPPRDTARRVRTATITSVTEIMRVRTQEKNGYTITTLLPYRHPLVRALIIQTKFADDRLAAMLLAHVLRTYLKEESTGPLVLVPIPLSPERERERGYNQVERVVELAAVDVDNVTIASTLLRRIHNTRPQTQLSGVQRHENMQHAFRAEPCNPTAQYLVIDDVMTTGSTIREACAALTRAHATQVAALALAH